jgi:alpha-glucoside transport system permease protein
MAEKTSSYASQKRTSSLLVNGVLILICLIWIIPALGVFITSFRQSQDIFLTGWWAVFPHREYVKVDEIKLDESIDVDNPFQIEGITTTFEQLRNGVTLEDGRQLVWFGNKRTRLVEIFERQWKGFTTNPHPG